MKNLVVLIAVLIPFILPAQVDTVFKNSAYTSFFSFKHKEPLVVAYKLYKGGGSCKRDKFYFKTDCTKTASDADYSKSGYDKGHLANAEDFAYDCTLEEMTFRYYNCFPQTPALNRGKWKTLENKVRKISQKDSIIVISGGLYNNTTIGSGIGVPDTCFKVIYYLKDKTFSPCYLFTNITEPEQTPIIVEDFNKILFNRYTLSVYEIVESFNE